MSFCQNYNWLSDIQFPGLERDDAVAFTLNNTIYLGTGNHSGFSESNRFYSYNTSTGIWKEVEEFPGAARQYASVEVSDGKAYLIGGIDLFNNPLNDVWQFDPNIDQWTQKANFPGQPRWAATSFQIKGIIYYGTGKTLGNYLNDFWKYDPLLDEWIQLKDISFLPRFETIGFSLYDDGFIGLGKDCTETIQSDLWCYKYSTDSWELKSDFPGGKRYYAKAEVLKGYAFVGTGENEIGEMPDDFWKYNPINDSWSQVYGIPNPGRRGVASCAIQGRAIYFCCGLSNTYQRLNTISILEFNATEQLSFNAHYNQNNQSIYVSGYEVKHQLRIFSMDGKIIYDLQSLEDHILINVNDWERGIYIINYNGFSKKIAIW